MKLSRKHLKFIRKFCRMFDYPYNETRNTIQHLNDEEGKIYMDKMHVFVGTQEELKAKADYIKGMEVA